MSDKRLNNRYRALVKAHLKHHPKTAPGIAVPAEVASSFAATQAAWRFFQNEKVTFQKLIEPLQQFARQQIDPDGYALSIFDWSKLDYRKHTAKTDVGYESTTQLLVDAQNGRPIAPFQMHLKTADGLLSTMTTPPENVHHLEQVLPMMDALKNKLLQKISSISSTVKRTAFGTIDGGVRRATGSSYAAIQDESHGGGCGSCTNRSSNNWSGKTHFGKAGM